MVQNAEFDNGRDIDWGKTSEDYAKYRPGPPLEDPISGATEKLVLKYNPDWTAHSFRGHVDQFGSWFEKDFYQTGLIIYDENLKFSRETWRGRIRALRGIGASLSPEQVKAFDREHDHFIPHRIIARVLALKNHE